MGIYIYVLDVDMSGVKDDILDLRKRIKIENCTKPHEANGLVGCSVCGWELV